MNGKVKLKLIYLQFFYNMFIYLVYNKLIIVYVNYIQNNKVRNS